MTSSRSWAVVATLALCTLGTPVEAAPSRDWTVVPLTADSPAGGGASDVNDRGDVVGATRRQTGPLPFGFTSTAFLWRNGVREDIGSAVGRNSTASSVSDRGSVALQADGRAYLWKDGQATPLNLAGTAVAVNKRDEVAGTYWTGGAVGSGEERPYLMRDGVLFELPTLSSGGTSVSDLNDRGQVVGFSSVQSSVNSHAVLWDGLAIRDLGTLDGGSRSFANRINNHGVIVGTSFDATGARYMVRWNADGRPIEKLAANYLPTGINDRGAIVGSDMVTGMPFLYEDGAITNLLALPAMQAGGWTSFTPSAINDHGWIVGTASKPGGPFFGTAVLLIPK